MQPSTLCFIYIESISHLGMTEVWFCKFCGSNDIQHELVCSVHRSLDAWKLTDNTMHEKAASRHTPEEKGTCSHSTKLHQTLFQCSGSVFGAERQQDFPLFSSWVGYTCRYKSGTHYFLYCLGWDVPGVTETVLDRSISHCQEAVSSLSWSKAAISPRNLFCRVVTSDMKYSSYISGLTRVQVPEFEWEWHCQRNVSPESN